MLVVKNEHMQPPGQPGWMGTARVERLIKEPGIPDTRVEPDVRAKS